MKKMLLGCAVIAALSAGVACAQNYPNKPIRLIAPSSAGGPVDVIARILSPAWSEALGQQLVIDNRAGAAGQIGSEMVAKAPKAQRDIDHRKTPQHGKNPAHRPHQPPVNRHHHQTRQADRQCPSGPTVADIAGV